MADSFFGFNTALIGSLDEGLHDDPGQGLDEEEEEYDALNDETFGTDAVEGDWEKDHEKLAEMTEQSRVHRSSYDEATDGEDLDLEASLSQLVLDEFEDLDDGIGHSSANNPHRFSLDVAESASYSSSAPSGISVWGVSNQDTFPSKKQSQAGPLTGVKNVCTVEELERGLISGHTAPPVPGKPAVRVEELEREISGFPPRVPLQGKRGQDMMLMHHQNGLGRNIFPHLGLGRGSVPPPYRQLGVPPLIPDMRQLRNQQNNRLMGSAPNLLRFLPPHLLMSQGMRGDGGAKPLIGPHHGFPPNENIILHNMHRNNVGFRPGFQFAPRPPLWGYHPQQHPRGPNPLHQHPQQGYQRGHNGTGDYDEYAGLMTLREKQWLLNIQLLQLNTSQPYVEDFYYTVFASRQPNKDSRDRDGPYQRERRDSHRDREQQSGPRLYTPVQFENSLGKLQVGSVTAPRKIIDMDVVPTEGKETTPQSNQKDTRKTKQILLELERLYLMLLQIEDLSSPVPELRELVTENKADLVHKIIASLLTEDRLINTLCTRKGKMLLLRLLPHAADPDYAGQLCEVWTRLCRSLLTLGRRDSEGLLSRLHPHLHNWLRNASFESLLELGRALAHKKDTQAKNNPLVYALGNKFGVSVLASLLDRAETLLRGTTPPEKQQLQDWSTVVVGGLVEAAAAVRLLGPMDRGPTPLQPLDSTLLARHLGRCCANLQIERYAILELALTGHHQPGT